MSSFLGRKRGQISNQHELPRCFESRKRSVRSVLPTDGSDDHHNTEHFDQLIMAILPPFALEVLGDQATAEEVEILSGFETTAGTVVVHRDARFAPPIQKRVRYGNRCLTAQDLDEEHLDPNDPFFLTKMTLSTVDDVTPVFAGYDFTNSPLLGRSCARRAIQSGLHPSQVDLNAEKRRELVVSKLQGVKNIRYCGSWISGLTLHEDAVTSGLVVGNEFD